MKIICDREKFLAAFQTAAAVAPSRSPKPILQNVKLEVSESSATLMATDLEIGIRIQVPGITVEQPGSAILPISRFGLILRESSDEKLFLETSDSGTLVRGDRSEFKLPGENPDEFPDVAVFADQKFYQVSARLLKELIRRTIFATDSESSRYALGGVLLEFTEDSITAVATDGRRLAKMSGPGENIEGYESAANMTIVPARAMQMIERILNDPDADVQIVAHDNDILVRTPRATIYSRLVEGRFPRWRDVFPQRDDAVKIDLSVGPFYSAVKQAAIVTSEDSRGVDFTFDSGSVVLSGRAAELGQSRIELPISYTGDTRSIKLDPRYVGDFLRVLDSEKMIQLELKDAESAAVATTDDGYGYVIMPLASDH